MKRWAAIVALAMLTAVSPVDASHAAAVEVSPHDIGGRVSGSKGPEAGVWVIAQTTDFPTRYAKVVVTDDQGSFVIPELPDANYKVWVRGYGLQDSAQVESRHAADKK